MFLKIFSAFGDNWFENSSLKTNADQTWLMAVDHAVSWHQPLITENYSS